MTVQKTIPQLLNSDKKEETLALFKFSSKDSNKEVIFKFNLWARKFFAKYFTSEDAEFHKQIDLYNLQAYSGEISTFTDCVFRDGAKTTRTKLFYAYVLLNDEDVFRKYLKVLSKDLKNSTQSVTDIYNILVYPQIVDSYGDAFKQTGAKREETMSSFTTYKGIKLTAGTVGTDQRGHLQEEGRPDLIWYDDFETKKTLRSAVETNSIWDNMEEAKNGLAKDGSCIYTCNYVSESGNVHKLINNVTPRNIVINIPIIDEGVPTWSRYSLAYINQKRIDTDDFEGEYLGNPAAGADVLFNRTDVEKQVAIEPVEELAGLKVFYKYDASSRYAGGQDVGGGVGLDSSTDVIIDFDTIPARVVATFANNEIKPETFGDEIKRHGDIYGTCLMATEKNFGAESIYRLRLIYPLEQIHKTQGKATKVNKTAPVEYGWHTNAATKPKMMYALAKAVEKGLLDLSDKALIAEAKSYSRNDLLDSNTDPRLTTRHFDLLTACAIAWQMKDFAKVKKVDTFKQPEEEFLYKDIGV